MVLFKKRLEDFPQLPMSATIHYTYTWRLSPKAPSSRVAPVQVSSTIPPPAWAAWGRWCGRHWAERGDCLLSSRNWDFPPTSTTTLQQPGSCPPVRGITQPRHSHWTKVCSKLLLK